MDNFGVNGCGGGCVAGNIGQSFGATLQDRRKAYTKLNYMGVGQSNDDRENYAFICAAEAEQASGDSWDDARFNRELEKCRKAYDAMGGDYPVDDPGTGGNIPQGYDPSKACTDPATIYYVQMITGNPNPDGAWGPESQKYLDASGQTFMDIANAAGGCTGPAPVYKDPGTGGGTGGGDTTITVDVTDKEVSEGWLGLPWWAWGLIGIAAIGVGGGGVYLAARDSEKPKKSGVSEPKPKFMKRRAASKRAKSMKRDSKGRFLPKKARYHK